MFKSCTLLVTWACSACPLAAVRMLLHSARCPCHTRTTAQPLAAKGERERPLPVPCRPWERPSVPWQWAHPASKGTPMRDAICCAERSLLHCRRTCPRCHFCVCACVHVCVFARERVHVRRAHTLIALQEVHLAEELSLMTPAARVATSGLPSEAGCLREPILHQEQFSFSVRQLVLTPRARRPLLLCSTLMVVQQFSGINNAFNYSSTFLELAGVESRVISLSAIYMNLANVLVVLLASLLMDRVGRRPLLLVIQLVLLGHSCPSLQVGTRSRSLRRHVRVDPSRVAPLRVATLHRDDGAKSVWKVEEWATDKIERSEMQGWSNKGA